MDRSALRRTGLYGFCCKLACVVLPAHSRKSLRPHTTGELRESARRSPTPSSPTCVSLPSTFTTSANWSGGAARSRRPMLGGDSQYWFRPQRSAV